VNESVIGSYNQNGTHLHHEHQLCWKSVTAGVFISIMSFLLLTALGTGLGGMIAVHLINADEGGSGLASGAGVWLGVSCVVSLFMGSYFAARISSYHANKIGAAHGFVVASIFFTLLVLVASSSAGHVFKGVSRLLTDAATTSANIAAQPAVQDIFGKALGAAPLKSPPGEVMQGLALRLGRGDTQSAKSYLAYQTGQPEAEVSAKIDQAKADFDQTVKVVGEKAAAAVSTAGWSLFVTFFVGLLSALIGGRVAVHANVERPLQLEARTQSSFRKPATA
jgi:hypothetical protein